MISCSMSLVFISTMSANLHFAAATRQRAMKSSTASSECCFRAGWAGTLLGKRWPLAQCDPIIFSTSLCLYLLDCSMSSYCRGRSRGVLSIVKEKLSFLSRSWRSKVLQSSGCNIGGMNEKRWVSQVLPSSATVWRIPTTSCSDCGSCLWQSFPKKKKCSSILTPCYSSQPTVTGDKYVDM